MRPAETTKTERKHLESERVVIDETRALGLLLCRTRYRYQAVQGSSKHLLSSQVETQRHKLVSQNTFLNFDLSHMGFSAQRRNPASSISSQDRTSRVIAEVPSCSSNPAPASSLRARSYGEPPERRPGHFKFFAERAPQNECLAGYYEQIFYVFLVSYPVTRYHSERKCKYRLVFVLMILRPLYTRPYCVSYNTFQQHVIYVCCNLGHMWSLRV